MPPNGSSLTITNPLVLYRSLISTNRIQPDPAQHRLALRLQKLYERLIDYEPSIEYSDRLKQLSRTISPNQNGPASLKRTTIGTRGLWTSLLAQKEKRDSLALTRVLTSHEAALTLQSPKGLLLHGDVGTGKSMLIDLFADSLPSRKKRRWHFNTFMLETISRLEQLRKARLTTAGSGLQDEYSLLWLARDLIEKSPVLFLDEFQLPDRVAAKMLSNLMTSFFQLGGVLIATSNRMPEELAKAAGMEFERPVSRMSRLGWDLGMRGQVGKNDGAGQMGEFARFLEVLRARCDVWEMDGKVDYRRVSGEGDAVVVSAVRTAAGLPKGASDALPFDSTPTTSSAETTLPKYYFLTPPPTASPEAHTAHSETLTHLLHTITSTPPTQSIPWTPTTLTVYSRPLFVPAQHAGVALFTFSQLCAAVLGPADYITLASTFHTFVLTDVPVLRFLQKNEARRLITLLDALYEARCRLLVTAEAGPDGVLFPTSGKEATVPTMAKDGVEDGGMGMATGAADSDAVHSETFAEIHQDLTARFRPNVSSYTGLSSASALPIDALEDDPPNRVRRPGSSYTDERRTARGLDFANIRGLTGEDEVFAVKRAESRLWEMCSGKWWARAEEGGLEWWKPLPVESRHWERGQAGELEEGTGAERPAGGVGGTEPAGDEMIGREGRVEGMFPHGASPFRTVDNAPPRIWDTHVWGVAKWGKRAGAWGKGVEGLAERKREKEGGAEEVNGDKKKL